jgi:hypothetical protein
MILVLDGYRIERTIIHTHPKSVILLLHKIAGQPYGEELGRMNPFYSNSSNYFFISANFGGAIW